MKPYKSESRHCADYLSTNILADSKTTFDSDIVLGRSSKNDKVRNPWKFKLEGKFVSVIFHIWFLLPFNVGIF